MIHYLTPAEIYAAAEEAIGRKPDVRDRHLLRSAAARPALHAFGEEAYPTLLDKAAAIMHSMAAHHLFFDGNKRTATRVTSLFLESNGLRPTWDDAEVRQYVLEIAQNQHDVPEIAAWLAEHTAPTEVRYVTVDELIYINEQFPGSGTLHTIVEGKRKVRDMSLLEAAAARPMQTVFGEDAYPTVQEKAAALLHSLARNHPFADGNKRTAAVAALFMLEINGLRAEWEPEIALHEIIQMAEGKLEVQNFAAWLPAKKGVPALEQDAERDIQIIKHIMDEHRWLLDELAKQ